MTAQSVSVPLGTLRPHRIVKPKRIIKMLKLAYPWHDEAFIERSISRARWVMDWEGQGAYVQRVVRVVFRTRHSRK